MLGNVRNIYSRYVFFQLDVLDTQVDHFLDNIQTTVFVQIVDRSIANNLSEYAYYDDTYSNHNCCPNSG